MNYGLEYASDIDFKQGLYDRAAYHLAESGHKVQSGAIKCNQMQLSAINCITTLSLSS